MADTKKKTTTKAPAKSTKSTAKTKATENNSVAKPENKPKSNTTKANSTKAASSKTVAEKKTTAKKVDEPKKAISQSNVATPSVKKSSGNGVATFALLCALGALGLSGYNLYERKFSPEANSAQSLLSGVNDIGNNVTQLGNTVTSLQEEVSSIVEKQTQYATVESLNTAIEEQVAQVVESKAMSTTSVSTLVSNDELASEEKNESVESTVSTSVLPLVSGSEETLDKSSVPTLTDTQSGNDDQQVTGDSSGSPEVAWTWERAKADFFDMFNFISIRKKDENNN